MTAGRTGRLAAVTVVLLALCTSQALAIGAQGVDLEPELPRRNGTLTAVIEPGVPIPLRLTNTAEEDRTVTVSASQAATSDGGGINVGPTLDWISINGGQDITLAPGDERRLEAVVDVEGYRASSDDRILFLLEVQTAGNVAPRAATIVALADSGASLPRSTTLIIVAGWILVIVAAAWWRFGRTRPATYQPAPPTSGPTGTVNDSLPREPSEALH